MTVDSTPQIVIYNTDGMTTVFTFPFSIDQISDIQVWYDQTLLTILSNYTVACLLPDCSTGGTVTTLTTYPSGHTITITTNIPITQAIDFMENMPTLYKNFESGLDKLTRIAKQHLPVGSVYLSIYNTDPATTLGYGTWIAQGTLTSTTPLTIYVFKRTL